MNCPILPNKSFQLTKPTLDGQMRAASHLIQLLLFLSMSPSVVHACECLRGPSGAAAVRHADLVFVGTADSVFYFLDPSSVEHGDGSSVSGRPIRLAVFRVEEMWKGAHQPVVAVFGGSGIDCGVYFREGRKYLVFADEVRPKHSIGLIPREYGRDFLATACSGTQELGTSAWAEIEEIREAYPSWQPDFIEP